METTKMTQQQKILTYIKAVGRITIRDAFYLGINSPSKRLSELMEKGLVRVEEDVKVYKEDSKGNKVQRTHYKVYKLA